MRNTRKISVALVIIIAVSMLCCMAASAFGETIQYGSTGENVYLLQQDLDALGYDPGPWDGIFGSKTLSAVKSFQRDHGLKVDGIVGPKTWDAIFSEFPDCGCH